MSVTDERPKVTSEFLYRIWAEEVSKGGGWNFETVARAMRRAIAQALADEMPWCTDETHRAQAERIAALERGLKQIAEHPHNDYDHQSNGGGKYGEGCADGHRCAAALASRLLEKDETGRTTDNG